MLMSSKMYPAKLLLFGEYSVIKGGEALAIPFKRFYGFWLQQTDKQDQTLLALFAYLKQLKHGKNLLADLDLNSFEKALLGNLQFQSNIPQGYGLGSSGALCAAIYDTYKIKTETQPTLIELKKMLGQIESFFHGSSSGLDPLICYLNKSILIENNNHIRAIGLPQEGKSDACIFLLNTGLARKSEPIIQWFVQQCEDEYFYRRCMAELVPYASHAIHSFLQKDMAELKDSFHKISFFQYRYFSPMILEIHRTIWLDCLASDFCKLKICGAGAGGFILGYSEDYSATKHLLKDYELIKVFNF